MNKEKNIQQESKKEHTSVLEKIRRRTGLLVGIVGLALVIFILESLLGSGASIFGGDEMSSVGTVNGKKIDRNEFVTRMENQLASYRQRQGREVDETVRGQVIESIYQQYVVTHVMMPGFEKAGITVGDDELYENVVVNPAESVIQNLTDPNTGRVNEQFSRPDGTLDPVKWRQAVQSVTGESEVAVKQMEDMVKSTIYFKKFRALVTKGLYITQAEAKEAYRANNTTANISYVMKRFDSMADSLVKVSESDIEKYYKEHSHLYKSLENSRKIEYIVYDVLPSAEDVAEVEKEAIRVADEFKKTDISEDSMLMAQESENGNIVIQDLSKKTMIIRDSSVYTAAPGTVFGPYNEGAYYKIYKLQAINSIADSAKVRHILVGINDPQTNQPKRSMPQAKREADSLLTLIKEKKVNFEDLVVSFSDDMGSKTNGGDYGWFDENKQFVEPFKNAGLRGAKGNISVVETQFGYHIIEVLDVSKTRHTSYRVAQIFKLIAPSDETNQAVFAKASQFSGENNTAELFDKAAEKQDLTKRVAEDVKEGDYQLPGLEGARDLVKWSFNAEKGEVSVFSLTDKHVVAKLAGIRPKGTLPLEEVKEEVTAKAIQAKKAEMFLEEFKTKGGNTKNVQELAQKLGLTAQTQENISLSSHNVNGIGHDDVLMGTVAGSKAGSTSKPTASSNGVFVVAVNAVNPAGPTADFSVQRKELESAVTGRSDYDVFNAMKEDADIEFHKSRID